MESPVSALNTAVGQQNPTSTQNTLLSDIQEAKSSWVNQKNQGATEQDLASTLLSEVLYHQHHSRSIPLYPAVTMMLHDIFRSHASPLFYALFVQHIASNYPSSVSYSMIGKLRYIQILGAATFGYAQGVEAGEEPSDILITDGVAGLEGTRTALLECISDILQQASASTIRPSLRRSALHNVSIIFMASPSLTTDYIKLAKPLGRTFATCRAALVPFISTIAYAQTYWLSGPVRFPNATRQCSEIKRLVAPSILQWYLSDVLNATSTTTDAALSAFTEYLKSLTTEDLTLPPGVEATLTNPDLLQSILKALRLRPSSAVPALVHTISSLSPGVLTNDQIHAIYTPFILNELRQSDPKRQSAVTPLCKALHSQIVSLDTITSLTNLYTDVLLGTNGQPALTGVSTKSTVITVTSHWVSYIGAIPPIVAFPKHNPTTSSDHITSALSSCSSQIIQAYDTILASETSDPVKQLIYSAFTQYTSVSRTVPRQFIAMVDVLLIAPGKALHSLDKLTSILPLLFSVANMCTETMLGRLHGSPSTYIQPLCDHFNTPDAKKQLIALTTFTSERPSLHTATIALFLIYVSILQFSTSSTTPDEPLPVEILNAIKPAGFLSTVDLFGGESHKAGEGESDGGEPAISKPRASDTIAKINASHAYRTSAYLFALFYSLLSLPASPLSKQAEHDAQSQEMILDCFLGREAFRYSGIYSAIIRAMLSSDAAAAAFVRDETSFLLQAISHCQQYEVMFALAIKLIVHDIDVAGGLAGYAKLFPNHSPQSPAACLQPSALSEDSVSPYTAAHLPVATPLGIDIASRLFTALCTIAHTGVTNTTAVVLSLALASHPYLHTFAPKQPPHNHLLVNQFHSLLDLYQLLCGFDHQSSVTVLNTPVSSHLAKLLASPAAVGLIQAIFTATPLKSWLYRLDYSETVTPNPSAAKVAVAGDAANQHIVSQLNRYTIKHERFIPAIAPPYIIATSVFAGFYSSLCPSQFQRAIYNPVLRNLTIPTRHLLSTLMEYHCQVFEAPAGKPTELVEPSDTAKNPPAEPTHTVSGASLDKMAPADVALYKETNIRQNIANALLFISASCSVCDYLIASSIAFSRDNLLGGVYPILIELVKGKTSNKQAIASKQSFTITIFRPHAMPLIGSMAKCLDLRIGDDTTAITAIQQAINTIMLSADFVSAICVKDDHIDRTIEQKQAVHNQGLDKLYTLLVALNALQDDTSDLPMSPSTMLFVLPIFETLVNHIRLIVSFINAEPGTYSSGDGDDGEEKAKDAPKKPSGATLAVEDDSNDDDDELSPISGALTLINSRDTRYTREAAEGAFLASFYLLAQILGNHAAVIANSTPSISISKGVVTNTSRSSGAGYPLRNVMHLLLGILNGLGSDTALNSSCLSHIPSACPIDVLSFFETLSGAFTRIAPSFNVADLTIIISNEALFSTSVTTRYAALQACTKMRFLYQIQDFISVHEDSLKEASPEQPVTLTKPTRHLLNLIQEFNVHISTLCFDRNPSVAALAKSLSTQLNLEDLSSRAGLILNSPRVVQPQSGGVAKSNETPFDLLITKQLSLLAHESTGIRLAASASLSHIISVFSTSEYPLVLPTLQRLETLYPQCRDVVIRAQTTRETDRLISHAEKRIAIAKAMSHIAPLLSRPQCQSESQGQSLYDLIQKYISIVVEVMLRELDLEAWEASAQAGVSLIHIYGNDAKVVSLLSQYLLASLPTKQGSKGTRAQDPLEQAAHEGVVVLLSSLSRYIDRSDTDRLKSITDSLVSSSKLTSSDSVHHAIGACLGAVLQHIDDDYVNTLYDSLYSQCIENRASDQTTRMACAVCLTAIVRAKGGAFFFAKQLMSKAIDAVKSSSGRQFTSSYGGLCIIYQLFQAFQHTNFMCPYVRQIIPLLLATLASDKSISHLARRTSNIVMKTASSSMQGASKVILPLLIAGLRDKSWKNKVCALQMISSIVGFSSKDLSLSLPIVLPRLIELRRDANPDVAETAGEVLTSLADVIRNPEVKRIAHTIIDALSDTNTETIFAALEEMYTTVFMHYIDPISLALTIPLIIYGLKERRSEVKKIAVQIGGSVTMITERNEDISPYIQDLLALMKISLMDSIPDVRKVTGKAIGTMVKTATQTNNQDNLEHFQTLLRLLLDILSQKDVLIPVASDLPTYASNGTTSVQRSGSALGVSHILHHMGGIEAVERYYDDLILPELSNKNAAIREGYLQLLYYLPVTFGQQFKPMVSKCLPVIVGMLNDSNAFCREYAQKAAQEMVMLFATSLTDEILATILESLLDRDYRIRTGSSILAASFLLRLCGLSGEITIAEAEDQAATGVQTAVRERNAITSPQQEALMLDYMSVENKHELYCSLYLLRTDPVHSVSAVAWRVWKAITPSTTRTLSSILPRLVERITMDLASFNEQRQITAGRALAELISKLGDRILRDVVPILLDKVASPDIYTRSGVCLGFKEIFQSATKSMLSPYIVDIFPTIHAFLCDPEEMVRDSGCKAFLSLAISIGCERATKEIVPELLKTIDEEHKKYTDALAARNASGNDNADDDEDELVDNSAHALAGLRGIVGIGYVQKACLDFIIPYWVRPPISQFYVTCIAYITDVCGRSFHNYLENVIRSLYNALLQCHHVIYVEYGEENIEATGKEVQYNDDGDVIIPQHVLDEQQELIASARHVFVGLSESHMYAILETLMNGISTNEKYTTVDEQLTSLKLIELFFRALSVHGEKLDLDDFGNLLNQTISTLIQFFVHDNNTILTFAGNAFLALISVQHYDHLIKHLGYIRTQLNLVTGKHSKRGVRSITELSVFDNTNLLQQLLGIAQHGIVSAPPLLRTQCAAILADVIELTPATTLAAHVMKITGFLIRTYVDKLTVEIRASVLLSLSFLIKKNSSILRPFQTQLRSMLLKTINNEEVEVLCDRAAQTLAVLARPETFIVDLVAASEKHVSSPIGGKILRAAVSVLTENSDAHTEHITVDMFNTMITKLTPYLGLVTAHDSVRIESSRLIGIMIKHIPIQAASSIITNLLADCGVGSGATSHYVLRQSVAMVLSCVLIHSSSIFPEAVGYKNAIGLIARGFKDDNELASTAAVRFSGRLLLYASKHNDQQIIKMLTQEQLALCQPNRNTPETVVLCALQQVHGLANYDPDILTEMTHVVVPLCIRTRTGASRSIRKECDVIMAYALGFHESYDEGMENAMELSQKFDKTDAAEFIELCKRSISKAIEGKSSKDTENNEDEF